MAIRAQASGNTQPIRVTIQAEAIAVATAEAQSILGSGLCPAAADDYLY